MTEPKKQSKTKPKPLPYEAYNSFCKKYPRASRITFYIAATKKDVIYKRVSDDPKAWANFKKCTKIVLIKLWVMTGPEMVDMGIGKDVFMSAEQRQDWKQLFYKVCEEMPDNPTLEQIAKKYEPVKFQEGRFTTMLERWSQYVTDLPF